MKFTTSLIAALATLAVSVAAGHAGEEPALMARHARLARKVEADVAAKQPTVRKRKTCKPKAPSTSGLPVPKSSSVPTTTKSAAPQPTGNSGSTSGGGSDLVTGLVQVVSAGNCGPSGATKEITALSGPNGNIEFLNCGLTSGGWNPPLIHVNDIVSAELSAVAYQEGSAFAPCKEYVPIFEKYGNKYGVPAIMLASFAMQESSCIASTQGGAGEQGLMQITADKCGGAPNGDCKEPDFNIHQGAKFFSETLASLNGDLLMAIGQYNGWYKGLTYAKATYAAHHGNCHEQNNLDYLHQFLNGWIQNVNSYEHNPPLGKYFNLNVCGN
ncbi:glycoside hydrolase family 23 protein [Hydnomerulius pinastri MD-312]|nr:glycoside hydrolase family 23 protein [Hydnomerulius pinastri MD-312]